MTDTRDPSGGEIARFGYRYSPGGDKGTPNFWARLRLTGPSPREATYTVYVLDTNSENAPLASQSASGEESDSISFEMVVEADDKAAICAYATRSVENKVMQRIPEVGCRPVDEPDRHDYEWYP